MIESLTTQQKAKLPTYAQKWIKIGLSTEPCSVTQSKKCINKAYKNAGLTPPKKYMLFDSPLSCVDYQVKTDLGILVRNKVYYQVSAPIRHQLRTQIMNQVWSQTQVLGQVWYQAWDQVFNQVWDQVWDQVGYQVYDQAYGNHDAYWLGFYEFFLKELKLDCVKPLIPLINLAKHCGWWAPYKDICLIQHRPKEIHLNEDNQLHKDGGPALSYRDGFSVWSLNGVTVPQWLAETREEDIDPRRLLEIDNVQVRAEFVRKVGIERVCYSLKAKCVDKRDGYELLMLDLGDGRRRPYLRMQNPSVPELWHVEGVHPDCDTVYEALVWRNGGETEAPIVLT